MKVIISFFLSIILAYVPCFAYSADSFVIDTDPYVFKKVQSASLMSASPVMTLSEVATADDSSSDSLTLSDATLFLNSGWTERYNEDLPLVHVHDLTKDISWNNSSSSVHAAWPGWSISTDPDTFELGCLYNYFHLTFTPPSGATAFSISSNLFARFYNYFGGYFNGSNSTLRSGTYSFDYYIVYVDDVKVTEIYPVNGRFVSDYLYSQSNPINSIRIEFLGGSSETFDLSSGDRANAYATTIDFQGSFSLDFIGKDVVFDGYNNHAQNDINNHNAIESQWTGSMSQNFADLNLASFSFPAGAASAFSLISGIFTDLWNSMGDFKIAYVFPLYLGIVLLLVGRISKFSGGRSSSGKGKGDDSA